MRMTSMKRSQTTPHIPWITTGHSFTCLKTTGPHISLQQRKMAVLWLPPAPSTSCMASQMTKTNIFTSVTVLCLQLCCYLMGYCFPAAWAPKLCHTQQGYFSTMRWTISAPRSSQTALECLLHRTTSSGQVIKTNTHKHVLKNSTIQMTQRMRLCIMFWN